MNLTYFATGPGWR